jgi:prophage antirepressor-like protein
MTVKSIDEDDLNITEVIDSLGREQRVNIINESGLYQLILLSRKSEAKKFKKWVTSEVIPSIRKHGAYVTPDKLEEMLVNPDFTIKLLTEIKSEREKRQEIERINQEMRPKSHYYDLILQSKSLLTTTQIGKDYGISAKKLNNLLFELGVQFKQSNTWLLYQKYADKGYTQSKSHIIDAEKSNIHTYWTQKGRIFIYKLLKEKGILPMIEREQMCILNLAEGGF